MREAGESIDLGDVSVSTVPAGVSVTFRCEYPLDVTITSNAFAVEDIKARVRQKVAYILKVGRKSKFKFNQLNCAAQGICLKFLRK